MTSGHRDNKILILFILKFFRAAADRGSRKEQRKTPMALPLPINSPELANPTFLLQGDPANTNQSPVVFDAELARRAYESLVPRWHGVPEALVDVPRVNLEFVLARVIQIAQHVTSPAERPRFARLPEFDIAHVDALSPAAWGLWYARVQYLSASASKTQAQLPLKLVTQAHEVRARMMKALRYNLESIPEAVDELDAIAKVEGPVYLDLATDLTRLAAMYATDDYKRLLVDDKRNYDPADERAANTLATEILAQLRNAPDEAARWAQQVARGWVVLQDIYREVQAGGLFLDRNRGGEERYPSLYAIRVPAKTARKTDAEDEGEAPTGEPPTG